MAPQSAFSLAGKCSIDPFNGLGLLTEVISQKEATCFVETTFSGAQTPDPKTSQAAVGAFVGGDFLPHVLHVASLRFGDIPCDIVGKSQ